jgi:hypothetical protein
MASEFDGRPFAAGELVGLRDFDLTADGRLTGCTVAYPWKPGENKAVCGQRHPIETIDGMRMVAPHGFSMMLFNSLFHQSLRAMYGSTNPYPAPLDADEDHRAGSLHCSCGFHAYTDGDSHDYGDPKRITGIIRGYGVCTEGTRGFRAEKAQLVALVAPRRPRSWWSTRAIEAGPCGFYLGLVIYGLIAHRSHAVITGLVSLTAYVGLRYAMTVLIKRRRARAAARPLDMVATFRLVRRRYPDVPIYRSLQHALAAHPITISKPEVER